MATQTELEALEAQWDKAIAEVHEFGMMVIAEIMKNRTQGVGFGEPVTIVPVADKERDNARTI